MLTVVIGFSNVLLTDLGASTWRRRPPMRAR